MSLGQINLSDCTLKEFLVVICSSDDHMDYFCFKIFEISADTEYSGGLKKKKCSSAEGATFLFSD